MLGQREWTRVQNAPVQAQASFAVNISTAKIGDLNYLFSVSDTSRYFRFFPLII